MFDAGRTDDGPRRHAQQGGTTPPSAVSSSTDRRSVYSPLTGDRLAPSKKTYSSPAESAVRPDVPELEHCVTDARRLSCCPKGDATLDMTSVLRKLPLTHPVPSERRRGWSRSAFHERRPAGARYRASSSGPPRPSARAIPPPQSAESSTPWVRLHLNPGEKGTKQLLAQYGHPLICVRCRYEAHRKKRLKTVQLIVAKRDSEPPRPPFAQNQIVGICATFAHVAARDRVKQADGTWNPQRRVWQLRYDRVFGLGLHARIADDAASMPNAMLIAASRRCTATIQIEMLASTPRWGHLVPDARVAVQY